MIKPFMFPSQFCGLPGEFLSKSRKLCYMFISLDWFNIHFNFFDAFKKSIIIVRPIHQCPHILFPPHILVNVMDQN